MRREDAAKFIKSKEAVKLIEDLTDEKFDELVEKSKTLKLSLVMLVKNQEKIIADVLRRFSKMDIDEFIVIDTGSNDGTLKVLHSLQYVQVYEMNWVEDFSYMRNEASRFATGDWILAVDSDEYLLSEAINFKALIGLLEEVITEEFSISFRQVVKEKSSYGEPIRMYNPRLSKFYGLVHEELRSLSGRYLTPSILTNIIVQNIGAEPEEIERFNKNSRYSTLLSLMREKEPENPRWVALMNEDGINELIESKAYEDLLRYHLFQSKEFVFSKENLKESGYTEVLLMRYVFYLISCKRLKESEKVIEFSLGIFTENVYFLFYKYLVKIESMKTSIKNSLKESLHDYITLDKDSSFDNSNCDTQMFELAIAELNFMNNQQDQALNIIQHLTDKDVLGLWKLWHPKG